MEGSFWSDADLVFRYTRKQAIRDGCLVDITNSDFGDMLAELGIRIPVAMTAGAFHATVGGIDEPLAAGQTVEGRVRDVLYAMAYAIRVRAMLSDRVHFAVGVAQGDPPKRVAQKLWALCGPGDSGEPVITIMLEGED